MTRSTHAPAIPIIIATLVFATSGCALSTMTPIEPLEKDDSVTSVVADWPGLFVAPRVTGQYTYGLGDGDISGRMSTTVMTASVGATGRWYANDWLHLELQGDYMLGLDDLVSGGGADHLVSMTPRAIVYESSPGVDMYGGWDAAFVLTGDFADKGGFEIMTGPIIGAEIPIGDHGALQLEATVRPIFYSEFNGLSVGRPLHGEFEGDTLGAMPQFGVGYHF